MLFVDQEGHQRKEWIWTETAERPIRATMTPQLIVRVHKVHDLPKVQMHLNAK